MVPSGCFEPNRSIRCDRLAIVHCLLVLFWANGFTPRGHAAGGPNIVVLLADDAGYADFGFQDSLTGQTTEFKTPNLDSLAQQGIRFSNGYVSASTCSPSRAGLLTGQYQQRFGYEFNISNIDDPNDGMPTNQVMMTERFQQLGYTTGVVGKWHLGLELAKQPQNQGVDEFYGMWEGSRGYFGTETTAGKQIRDGNGVRNWTSEASFNNIPLDSAGKGRHVTDAFGDEASKFIANHAGDPDPFFLYLPFSSPHSPLTLAKQQDIDEFNGTSLSASERKIAALVFAMDRAVGNVLDRINDPNGDGDTSDSVADNTIVVFANDNGGTPSHDNGVLRGFKGESFEGGIRVPFLMRMPDPNNPGQFLIGDFDSPVTTRDLFPTFISAAGETMSTLTDGVDLTPFLTGQQTGDPHEMLAWRKGGDDWAIRKGDWKLLSGNNGEPIQLVQLAANGSGEFVDLSAQNPEKFQELLVDFTAWEAEMSKQSQDSGRVSNRFDHFVYRENQTTSGNWSNTNIWQEAGTSNNSTMQPNDAYPNAILEFRPRNDTSYIATNNMTRSTTLTYMLNELRFDGTFSGGVNRSGTINGNDVLLVDNLQGQGPTIQLNSTKASGAEFTFNIDTDLILFDDLTITGNSGLTFNINGDITAFSEDRSITKIGTSSVTLTGNNTFGGTLDVQQGAIVMAAGSLAVSELNIAAGGIFQFNGGTLKTPSVVGSLVNNGGTFAPGNSPAVTSITGGYTQNVGVLEIEIEGLIAGAEFDVVQIAGNLTAGGTLKVVIGGSFSPQVGQVFEIITANSMDGTFLLDSPKDLDGNDIFSIQYNVGSIELEVLSSSFLVDGDFTFDGVVNTADWKVLQSNLYSDMSYGSLSQAREFGDLNGDLLIDRRDFVLFKEFFTAANGAGSFAAMLQGVPEPSSLLLVAVGSISLSVSRLRRS